MCATGMPKVGAPDFKDKRKMTKGAPGRNICATAQQIMASAIVCATAVVTVPMAPVQIKGVTTIVWPREEYT